MGRRSRGDGSVFYDAARGCWVGSLDIGRNPGTRRRRRRKVSAPTKTGCREKLSELREEYRKAGTVGRRDITVRQVVTDWLSRPPESVRSERSVEVYRGAGARICDGVRGVAGIGGIPLARLTPADVERLLTALARAGYSASTVRQTRAVLARCLRRAQQSGLTSRNAAGLADLPRGAKTRKSGAMTGSQVAALLSLDLTAWWRAWIVTAVATGLRPGELAGLRWADADFGAGVITVRKSLKREGGRLVVAELKTEASRRTLAMPAMVAGVLQALRRAQAGERLRAGARWEDHGLVFAGTSGRPRWPQQIRAGFRRLCEQAGIGTDWQLRETRHTFVSALSDAGVDIERIADSVGHVNSTITKRVYRHSLADVVSETATVMDRVYPAAREPGGAS
jgi:integrase